MYLLAVLTKLILFKYLPLHEVFNHLDFTFNQYQWRSSNFIPFKTIFFYLFLADINLSIRIENLAGNILGFVPFGFLVPILTRKFLNTKSIIKATFVLNLTYEFYRTFNYSKGQLP
ncbi:VanZ family protein [Robertmurraya korlensis]|uniref:VanZ family protein n=1 Tax=Robertmurraya korlensis TaxID=519977 RepID=UPI003528B7B2